MKTIGRRAATAVAILSLLAIAATVTAAGARSTAPAAPKPVKITDEDLLAANLQWSDVRQALPSGWWPQLPLFNSGLEPGHEEARIAITTYVWVSPNFRRVTDDEVVSSVVLLPSRAAANAYYRDAMARDGGSTVAGPAVKADRWRYSRVERNGDVAGTLRWQIGPFVGRVTVTTFSGPDPDTLAKLFAFVADRVAGLRAGTFRSKPLSVAEQRLLPASSPGLGRILGTARLPIEAWASIDTSGKPFETLGRLQAGGVKNLLLRRFVTRGVPGNVIEVVLFPFADARGARSWAQQFVNGVRGGSSALDPGATGSLSAFTSSKGDLYELQFAQGRYVGDVACFTPYSQKVARACETLTRLVAERWYAALGGV